MPILVLGFRMESKKLIQKFTFSVTQTPLSSLETATVGKCNNIFHLTDLCLLVTGQPADHQLCLAAC